MYFTPGPSGPGSNGNWGVIYILHSFTFDPRSHIQDSFEKYWSVVSDAYYIDDG